MFLKIKSSNFIDRLSLEINQTQKSLLKAVLKDDSGAICSIMQKELGFGQQIDRAFRKVVQAIRAAADVRDLRAVRGLGFERLQGKRSHQCALRLNKQWRLIVEIVERNGKTRVRVIEIADYH